jgi:transcriptional regulator with XRE-family HTH domain
MSQVDLAEGLCTRSFISQIEVGKVAPSLETVSAIASRLDITVGELIGDQQSLAAAKATLFLRSYARTF